MGDPRRIRAYIGLGANLGDATRTLAEAVVALDALPSASVRGVSRLYATAPWGITDQPEFRNGAVRLDVVSRTDDPTDAALALLGRLKTLERAAGRRRGRRWGPRELDLDLLVFGRHRISVERSAEVRSIDAAIDPAKAAKRLEVPHRDLGERLFAVAPLADLAPRLIPPGWHETVGHRADQLWSTEPPGSVRAIATWDGTRRTWRRGRSETGRSGA